MRVVQQVALTKRVKGNEEWTTQQRGDNQVVSPLLSRDQPMDALVHPQSQRVLLDADQYKADDHVRRMRMPCHDGKDRDDGKPVEHDPGNGGSWTTGCAQPG